MKEGRSLTELAIELDRQNRAKKDLLVRTEAIEFVNDQEEGVTMEADGTPYKLNHIAHNQMAQFLRIPSAYYDRMLTEYPDLLIRNVNGWLDKQPDDVRMIRTLDGTARAILSDRYRRIDNFEIAQTVLPIIGGMDGAKVESCELTDSRMYIKVVTPKLQAEVRPGDVVQAGVIISNSEVGLGSVNVSPLIYRLVCSNGMVAEDASRVRRRHVGRRLELEEDFSVYRPETIEADDNAFLMKLADSVTAAVDETRFARIVGQMKDATEALMDPKAAPKVVELASKEYGFAKTEGEGILGHLIAGGDLSLYGLANAVTRAAQDVESYDRSTELETTGYEIITMAPSLWRRLSSV